jgi:hypothetical protein
MATKYFSEIVSGLGEGDLDERATKRLNEMVQKVEETAGTGKFTLTLTIKKQNRQVVIKPTFKAVMPEPAVDDTMFFVGADGELSRDDPKQLKLPRVAQPGRVVQLAGGKKSEASKDGKDPDKDKDDN